MKRTCVVLMLCSGFLFGQNFSQFRPKLKLPPRTMRTMPSEFAPTIRLRSSTSTNTPSLDFLTSMTEFGCTSVAGAAFSPLSNEAYMTGTADCGGAATGGSVLFVWGSTHGLITDYYTFASCDGSQISSEGDAIAIDSSGNIYVAGQFSNCSFIPPINALAACPVTTDLGYPTFDGPGILLIKFDASSNIVYSTCLTNSGFPSALVADSSGNVYVGGGSTIVKLDSTPNVVWSTSIPGTNISGLSLDNAGNLYVTGGATTAFHTLNAIQTTGPGAFLEKMTSSATPVYATFLTGVNGGDGGNGVATDSFGNVYVAGSSGNNAFLTSVNSAGTAVLYSTEIGGSTGSTTANGIGVDNYGGVYLTGTTYASDLPIVNGIFPTYRGQGDGFVAHLDKPGSSLVYSTYIGGSALDGSLFAGVAGDGTVYAAGTTYSPDLPVTDGTNCFPDYAVYCSFMGEIGPFTTTAVAPASLTFPAQLVGTSSGSKSISVKNTGTAQMTITSIIATGDYTQTNKCQNGVKPGTHCNIYVSFKPSTVGTRNGAITITGNTNTSPQIVTLTGTGTNLFPTTTAVASSLNPSFVGRQVTFSAKVASGYGAIPDGETVTFSYEAGTLGPGTLHSGLASLPISSLSAGTHYITAAYPGDSSFASSTSSTIKQVVKKYPTTTILTSSLNPSSFGQSVTFTAIVSSSGPTPTGTVVFKNGTTTVGKATLSFGKGLFTTSLLPKGTNPITAVYGGDSSSLKSTSAVLNQVVQ